MIANIMFVIFAKCAIQGLKNESHAGYLYIQKERGTISYPTFEVPGMTYGMR